MSWDQGIQIREDLPERFIKLLEDKYFELYGERQDLQYITWFGLGEEFFADFGTDNSLSIKLKSNEDEKNN